jgi:WD40 repeat protein
LSDEAIKLTAGKKVPHPQTHFCAARRGESQTVYCGASDGKIHAIDFAADEPQSEPMPVSPHSSYVTGAGVAGHMLVTGSFDRTLAWWNLECREVVRSFRGHDKWIRRVVASPDGSIVASVADDMHCRLWDGYSGKLLHDLAGHAPLTPQHFPSMLFTCCFSPDGRLLATADKVGRVVIWDPNAGKQLAAFDSPEHYTWDGVQRRHSIGGIRSLAFSPDDRLLAAGGIAHIDNVDHLGGKALIHVFDWQAGERRHKFEHDKHNGIINALRFIDGGKKLLGAGGANEGFFLVMDLEKSEFVADEKAPMHIHDVAMNESTDRLYAVGHECSGSWEVA